MKYQTTSSSRRIFEHDFDDNEIGRPTIMVDVDSTPRAPTTLPKPPKLPELMTFEPRLRPSAIPEAALAELAAICIRSESIPVGARLTVRAQRPRESMATTLVPPTPTPTRRLPVAVKLRLVHGSNPSEPPTLPPPVAMRRAA